MSKLILNFKDRDGDIVAQERFMVSESVCCVEIITEVTVLRGANPCNIIIDDPIRPEEK